MSFWRTHEHALVVVTLIIALSLLEIVLYQKYGINLDSYSGYLASLAAVLGVLLTLNSITSWGNKQKTIQEGLELKRKEKITNKKIQLAEDIINTCYQIENAIYRISNPWSSSEELKEAKMQLSYTEQIKNKAIEEGLVFLHRFNKELNIINKLSTLKIQAKIYFGDQIVSSLELIQTNIHKQIYINIRMLLEGVTSRSKDDEGFDIKIWNLYLKENFMKEIIPKIEKILLPIIKDNE